MIRLTAVLLTVLGLAAPLAAQEASLATAQRIPLPELKKLQAENKVLVVDVRDPHSFVTGHIPGARSIPLASLLDPASVAELKATPKQIVLYCA